jgi:hypothetical protein
MTPPSMGRAVPILKLTATRDARIDPYSESSIEESASGRASTADGRRVQRQLRAPMMFESANAPGPFP